ncbi:ABC transporter permease [bacterium]|nr:ABC transporter permease [bacterium]
MFTLFRILKFGWLNFWRNWVLSSASIIVLSIALLIISSFVAFNFLLQRTIAGINQKVDLVVYFKEKVPEEDILDLKEELESWGEVKEVEYISKEKAYEKWVSRVQDERLKRIITRQNNPLPRSLEIRLFEADATSKVVDFLSSEELKDKLSKIRYNRLIVDKIVSYSKAVKKVGLILSLIFGLIAVYVVLNTLRLAVYARRNEIEIMKLVGASPGYIVFPFVVEGVMFGILGGLIAFVLALLSTKYALSLIVPREILQEVSAFLGQYSFSPLKLLALQVGVGVLIGVFCSVIGVKRYLREI